MPPHLNDVGLNRSRIIVMSRGGKPCILKGTAMVMRLRSRCSSDDGASEMRREKVPSRVWHGGLWLNLGMMTSASLFCPQTGVLEPFKEKQATLVKRLWLSPALFEAYPIRCLGILPEPLSAASAAPRPSSARVNTRSQFHLGTDEGLVQSGACGWLIGIS